VFFSCFKPHIFLWFKTLVSTPPFENHQKSHPKRPPRHWWRAGNEGHVQALLRTIVQQRVVHHGGLGRADVALQDLMPGDVFFWSVVKLSKKTTTKKTMIGFLTCDEK